MNHRVYEIIGYAEAYGIVPHYQTIPKFEMNEDNHDDMKFRLWQHQLKFLRAYERIEYDLTKDRLVDILNRMENEDERAIEVRITLSDIDEEFDIWTMYGHLHSITILKPEDANDVDNLLKWKVCMIFNEHQEGVVDMSVAEALGLFDHVIAWYALWRNGQSSTRCGNGHVEFQTCWSQVKLVR